MTQIQNAWNADVSTLSQSQSFYGQKWERCAENFFVMLTAGVSVGAISSLVLFRKLGHNCSLDSDSKSVIKIEIEIGIVMLRFTELESFDYWYGNWSRDWI